MLKKLLLALDYYGNNAVAKIASFHKRDKNLWLISERGDDAADNGYHLFKYLTEHPETGITPVYVIEEGSPDYQKVASLNGKIVEPGTYEHYKLIYQAGALISTHTYGYTPNMQAYHKFAKYHLFKPKGISVFLQHGILDKDTPWLYYDNFKPDIFVVSSDIEKRIVRTVCHQPEWVIKNIGLCRYDRLNHAGNPEKQILIMPTWREWLKDMNRTDFIQSDFCQKWRALLFNKNLIYNLSKQGYKIVFFLHPELQKYSDLFTHDGITVANENLQDIMMKSEILVTDYSSVYFDMAYMERNIIFFQFDKKEYETKHYNGLLINHNNFGLVAKTVDDTKKALLNACGVDGIYKKYGNSTYINSFFNYHDDKQCERTIEEIRKKQKLSQF